MRCISQSALALAVTVAVFAPAYIYYNLDNYYSLHFDEFDISSIAGNYISDFEIGRAHV